MENPTVYDFELKLFSLKSANEEESKELKLFKEIKNMNEDFIYCRFNRGVGHLAIRDRKQDFAKLFNSDSVIEAPKEVEKKTEEPKTETKEGEAIEEPEVKIGEIKLEIKEPTEKTIMVSVMQMSEKQKESFWRDHGKHLDSLVKIQFGQSIKYKTDGKANFVNTNIFLAGMKFKALSEVKNFFKKLLKSKKAGQVIEGVDAEMLKDIIKFHPKCEEKMKDFSGLKVDLHPKFPDTQCFFITKGEGVQEDFSYVKCLKSLSDSIKRI